MIRARYRQSAAASVVTVLLAACGSGDGAGDAAATSPAQVAEVDVGVTTSPESSISESIVDTTTTAPEVSISTSLATPTDTPTPASNPTEPPTEPAESADTSSVGASEDEAPASGCRRLTDFHDTPEDAPGDANAPVPSNDEWIIVNDGVMGGRSNGLVSFVDSTMKFSGTIVTAGGGFTSVRLRLDDGELADTTRIEMRVRTDGRIYGLTLEDDAQAGNRSVSHRADLITGGPDADGWSVLTTPYDALVPAVFGQPVDAPPFNPSAAREFGIIIADGIDGEFALEIDSIDACL